MNIIARSSNLTEFFSNYLKKDSIFKNRNVLNDSYIPEQIFHREKEINKIASVFAPALKLQKPSNLFIYGKTGTGKTLTVTYVVKNFLEVVKQHNLPIKIIYLNSRMGNGPDTEYKLIGHILKSLNKNATISGISLEQLYKNLFEELNKEKVVIIIIDEIDNLIKKSGDNFLYNLLRSHYETDTIVSLVGIGNDIFLMEKLDPRVKSSLFHEELVFDPYNAVQLADILRERAEKAFVEGAVSEVVIGKIAAIAAQEHGDARKAINLLRITGEIADRENAKKITVLHVKKAQEELDKNEIIESVKTLPKQHQIVLYSIFNYLKRYGDKVAYTGILYSYYEQLTQRLKMRAISLRRFSDILSELDLMGLIKAEISYLQNKGKTRSISIPVKDKVKKEIERVLEQELFE
jgi:cell division control protein 6